jgi:hypothetical protein
VSAAATPAPTDLVALYRDDGAVARLLARAGRRVPVPGWLPAVLAAAGLGVAIAVTGSGAATGTAAAVVAGVVVLGGLAAGRDDRGALRWLVPPALRACELAGLLWIAAVAGDAALPAAFALMAVVALRAYTLADAVRFRGVPPAAWLTALSAGWDGRLLLAVLLLALDLLPAGFYVWAALLGVALVAESATGWATARPPRGAALDDGEPGA